MTLTISALSVCGLSYPENSKNKLENLNWYVTQSWTRSDSTIKESLILIRFLHEFYGVSKLYKINVRIQEV